MPDVLCRSFIHYIKGLIRSNSYLRSCDKRINLTLPCINSIANYSRRSNSKNHDVSYKVVKSKVRQQNKTDILGGECSPNWELLGPRGNRFYFPNAVGPAWQGITSTLTLEQPLRHLVDFDGKGRNKKKLKVTVSECPCLIKKSLHELFPAPEVVGSSKIALVKLSISGNCETGALKFILAAREITARLRLHGYWADFMNPFSGKPFFSWASGKHLYKIDSRFRGINMEVNNLNSCTVIAEENFGDKNFSGVIYTNAPCDFVHIRNLLESKI